VKEGERMWKRFSKAWKIAKEMEQKQLTPMMTLPSYTNNKAIWKVFRGRVEYGERNLEITKVSRSALYRAINEKELVRS
jgi:hypothetical protein